MKSLNLGGLKIPANAAAARALAILAQRGAGKSNAAVVMAEEMHDSGLHWIAVDPKGDWWGIRSSSDGKGAGLPIVIFGGDKGDVPLEPDSGPELARLLVEERISAVVDVSQFTEGEKVRFLGGRGRGDGFAQALYRAKRHEQEPTHVFLEEAHDYIPQQPRGDKAVLVDAFGKIVTMGRSRGLGVTMISQRSARIHKDVLTQVDALIVLRIIGPQDRDAVAGWLKFHGQGDEIVASLSGLRAGEAWIWSPEWLGQTKRFQFRQRRTFDSGSTPTVGSSGPARKPATLAEVDLEAIAGKMKATIERAKGDDPVLLRSRIASLERALATAEEQRDRWHGAATERAGIENKLAEAERKIAELEQTRASLDDGAMNDLRRISAALVDLIASTDRDDPRVTVPMFVRPPSASQEITPLRGKRARAAAESLIDRMPHDPPRTFSAQVRSIRPELAGGDRRLGSGEVAILTAAAQHRGGVDRNQLSILTGYKRSSRDTYLQRLKSAGFISEAGGKIHATPAGVAALGDGFRPLPTGAALRDFWLEKLTGGERRIFEVVVERYPERVSREELSRLTGYRRSSRDTYIQRLASRKLIETDAPGMVGASGELFS